VTPFRYPETVLQRRHGPRGYAGYESYRAWLRDEFSFRCVYCLVREQWGRVRGTYDLDHYAPVAGDASGKLEYHNLVYACRACNVVKANQAVPDPCQVFVAQRVTVLHDGRILGRSTAAKRLILCLALNSPASFEFRKLWIDVIALARQYDPDLFQRLMSYPNDLPDLARLRPPDGNSRPEGMEESHFARRERGELAEWY